MHRQDPHRGRKGSPVKLTKDQDSPKNDRAIIIRHNKVDRYSPEVKAIGTGTLSDTRFVVIDRAVEKKVDCRYAQGYVAVRYEVTSFVTLYDRTTAKEIAKQKFAPPRGTCDQTLLVNTKTGAGHTEGSGKIYTRAPLDEVVAWAKSNCRSDTAAGRRSDIESRARACAENRVRSGGRDRPARW